MLQALTQIGSNWASFHNVHRDMNSYLKVWHKTQKAYNIIVCLIKNLADF